jgi:hypothetical protein
MRNFITFVPGRRLLLITALIVSFSLQNAGAQVLFYDDFESGTLDQWHLHAASGMVISTPTNRVPEEGIYSMQLTNSLNRMYANLTEPVTADTFKFTVWINDATNTATRIFAALNTYEAGMYNGGTLIQLFAIGKYNQAGATNHITGGPAEGWDGTKYQARMAFGALEGWFNLNDPGSPNRSTGWHRFDIEVGLNASGGYTANFYVDGILSRSVTPAYVGEDVSNRKWDSISVGLGAGSTIGAAYYDGFRVVQGQPFISQPPEDRILTVGDSISLSAMVTGEQPMSFQWFKDGEPVPGATSVNLSIPGAQLADSGQYTLVASNSLDTAASLAAVVTVNPVIQITAQPESQTVNEGSDVSFTVGASGPGTLTYQWRKDDIEIPGATSATFTVNNVQLSDAGSYTVVVSNGINPSTTSAPAVLDVNTPPVIAEPTGTTIPVGSLLALRVQATDDFSEQATPFSDFENFTAGTRSVMFVAPSFSGSTSSKLDLSVTNYTEVTDDFPAGHGSSNVLTATWAFDPAAASPWLRLTTFNSVGLPNPIISFTQRLRFDIYVSTPLAVGIAVRETNPTGAIGENGGTSAGIEWVGVTNSAGGAPFPSRELEPFLWTTLDFDVPNEPIRNFASGNGILNSTTGKGVLEHLAFVPVGDAGAATVYLDNFVVVPSDALTFSLDAAPPGAVIDSVTGVITWQADELGLFAFTVRVTDSGDLSSARTFTVTVQEAGSVAPGLITVTREGESIELNWEGEFILQSATDVEGPYVDITGRISGPHPVDTGSAAQTFFRLRN